MSEKATLNEAMAAAAEALLADGFLEGLAGSVKRDYPSLADEATNSVAFAVEKLITRKEDVRDPKRWLGVVAYNHVKRIGQRRASRDYLASFDEADGTDRADTAPTVDEVVMLREAQATIKAQIESWESGNVKSTMLLYLDAVVDEVDLSSEEAAELLGEILGTEIDADTVRTWLSRGRKRLGAQLAELVRDLIADDLTENTTDD